MSDISTASLTLLNDNGMSMETIELNKCGNVLIGNLTAPLASITYQLKGVDSIGLAFTHTTRQKATFPVGEYSFTTVGPPSTEIERSDRPSLVYRLQNLDSHGGYATVEFTASVSPSGGFYIRVEPQVATIQAGESVNVTLTAIAIRSSVRGGNSYGFKVSASDGCTSVDSEIHTVSIREPVSEVLQLLLRTISYLMFTCLCRSVCQTSTSCQLTYSLQATTLPPPDACGTCLNGGTCVVLRRGRVVCKCTESYRGTHCQVTGI